VPDLKTTTLKTGARPRLEANAVNSYARSRAGFQDPGPFEFRRKRSDRLECPVLGAQDDGAESHRILLEDASIEVREIRHECLKESRRDRDWLGRNLHD
jgi:hypothetical protein